MIDYLKSVYNTKEVPLRYFVKKNRMVNVADITSEKKPTSHNPEWADV